MDTSQKETLKTTGNPFPVRLGELEPLIIEHAGELDRSRHWLIKKLIRDGLRKRYPRLTK